MAFPESVRLQNLPAEVPARMLAWLLERRERVTVSYEGYGMWPAVPSGARLPVRRLGERGPVQGELVLVTREGGGIGLRRALTRHGEDGWLVAKDADPESLEQVEAGEILARVKGRAWPVARPERWHRYLSPALQPLAQLQKVAGREFPGPRDAAETVQRKYDGQAETYFASAAQECSPGARRFIGNLPPGCRILVVGCGTGTDLRVMLEMGHRPHGIDFSPAMIDLARRRLAGTHAVVEVMDVRRLRFAPGGFGAVFFTPNVYSFLPGRNARVAALRGIHEALEEGGRLFLSARLYKGPWEWFLSRVYLARGEGRPAAPSEPGDWFTTFEEPLGGLGSSYVHLFRGAEVRAELQEAGFGRLRQDRDEWTARRAP